MASIRDVAKEKERFGLLEFVMGNTREQFLEDARVLRELLEREER